MLRSALRGLALAAAILGAGATGHTDKTKAPTPMKVDKTKAPSAHFGKGVRTKEVRLCVYDFDQRSRPIDNPAGARGYVTAQGGLWDCDSFVAGSGYTRKLGAVSFDCVWGNADPAALVPCNAVITVASAAKIADKTPYSTIVATGWKTVEDLEGDLFTSDIVAPLVLRSSGSWPKPDAFKEFGWVYDIEADQLYVDITYDKLGWNPVYTKA